jgi:hypothetical protein
MKQNSGFEFGCFVISHAAKCGEKYETNLQLLSDIAVIVTGHEPTTRGNTELAKSCEDVIKLLTEKSKDDKEHLLKDIDVIRNNIKK